MREIAYLNLDVNPCHYVWGDMKDISYDLNPPLWMVENPERLYRSGDNDVLFILRRSP